MPSIKSVLAGLFVGISAAGTVHGNIIRRDATTVCCQDAIKTITVTSTRDHCLPPTQTPYSSPAPSSSPNTISTPTSAHNSSSETTGPSSYGATITSAPPTYGSATETSQEGSYLTSSVTTPVPPTYDTDVPGSSTTTEPAGDSTVTPSTPIYTGGAIAVPGGSGGLMIMVGAAFVALL